MDTRVAVVEWSQDVVRAYNPAMGSTACGATIDEALRKVGSPGSIGLCLGRRVSFVREGRVPDVPKSDLRLIVDVQLETLFPAVRTELAFDFEKGLQHFDDGVQTTVCAVQADALRAARSQGPETKIEWVAPVALGATEIARAQGHDDAIVVQEEDGSLNLDVVRHGMLVYSRSVVDGGTQMSRREEVMRTLAAYGLQSVAVIAVKGTDLGADVRVSESGTLSAMTAHDPDRVNIELPEVLAMGATRAHRARSRLATYLWLAVACAAALVWLDRDTEARGIAAVVDKDASQVSALESDIKLYTGRASGVGTDLKSLNLAFTPAQPASEVLTVVANSVPNGAWLTGITFDRGEPIQIRGTAVQPEAVSEFVALLAMDSRFRDVVLIFANDSEIESTPVTQFAVTAHVVGNLPLVETKQVRRSAR